MLSEDGRHWRGREDSDEGTVEGGVVTVRWQPWEDVSITTSLEAATDGWHARVHVVETERTLHTGEGGWCLPGPHHDAVSGEGRVAATARGLRSEIIDGGAGRRAEVIHPGEGTHLYWPVTVLPVLRGVLEPGHHVLKSLIYIGQELLISGSTRSATERRLVQPAPTGSVQSGSWRWHSPVNTAARASRSRPAAASASGSSGSW